MRNRTPKPTTPQTSSLDPVDHWVFTVTEKGLRACGAATLASSAARLRELADELDAAAGRLDQDVPAPENGAAGEPAHGRRRGTVCSRYRNGTRVPNLRLSGKWLDRAGFELGRKYQVRVDDDRLLICAVPMARA